ncbi:hypothetical protein GCK32_013866 [Trichostrongylus colubriformis]|uniref:TGF-beta propeptide domain-containing protein n=1 Tax=Trichostrongylus colubriformis TaxID=6319 RepID=A0AAN8IH64_TRICO
MIQEGEKQTFAYPLEEIPTAPFEEHFLDILELEEPPPVFARRKRSDKVAAFMEQLYHELEDDESASTNGFSAADEWTSADRIVSISPKESRLSDGLITVIFDPEDFPDTVLPDLVAAQLRIFLPKDFSVVKVYMLNNVTGTLSLMDSTIATSREATVWFNITQMVSDWMRRLSEPMIFIGIESGIDTPISKSEVETFVIASFMDESNFIPPPRTRAKRSADPPSPQSPAVDRKSVKTNPFIGARGRFFSL